MATKKIEMQYNLRQLNNEASGAHGKWYPKAVRRSTLSLRGLSDHIAGHGSIYTPDVVIGVLTKFTSCLIELVTEGTAVKLDGLGTFYPTLEASGADTPVGYSINEYLKGVHVRFYPEGADDDDITSREMKEKVILRPEHDFRPPRSAQEGQGRTTGGLRRRRRQRVIPQIPLNL